MFWFKSKTDVGMISVWIALVVSIPTVLFGFELGMLMLHKSELTDFFIEAVHRINILTGTLVLGLIFGVFTSGYISYSSGRKLTMLSAIGLGSLAVLTANVASNFTILLSAYLVNGFAFGLYIVPALVYICEVVAPIYRIATMLFIPICVFLGMLLSLVTSSLNSIESIIIYAFLLMVNLVMISSSLVNIPESPRFLAFTGSADAALNILFRLRGDMGDAARELAEINECCRGEARGVELYLQNNVSRRLLCFMCFSILLFNCGGATIVPYLLVDYLNYHLVCEEVSCIFVTSRWLLGLCFTAMLSGVVWHAWMLYKHSRRTIFMSDLFIGAVCLFFSSLCYVMPESLFQSLTLLVSLIVYIFFFFGGFIAFVCVVCIELLPMRGREFGMSAIGLTCSVSCLLGLQLFKPVFNLLSIHGFFLSCTLVSLFLAFIFFYLFPNAAIMSLEKLEARVMAAQYLSNLNFISLDSDKRARGQEAYSYGKVRHTNKKRRF